MDLVIGFSKHKGFAPLSWLIMLCEGTKFSHAYIQLKSESLDRELIYQATGTGVHFVGKKFFDLSSEVVEEYRVYITDEQKTKLLQWAVDNTGKPYGKLQLIGLGLCRLFMLFGIKIGNIFSNGEKAYVCCELVLAALNSLGVPGPKELDKAGLKDVHKIVSSLESI